MNDFQILPVSDIHMRRVFHLPILEIVGEKSGLHWVRASEGSFSCTQKWTYGEFGAKSGTADD